MDKITSHLVEESLMGQIRPLWGIAILILIFNIGILVGIGIGRNEPEGFYSVLLFGSFLLLSLAPMFLIYRFRKLRKAMVAGEWGTKVRQMRRRDDAENFPLVAAAVAIEKSEAGKRRTSDVRHKENRQLKAEVIEWWLANKHTGITKDAAAEAIAEKIIPLPFGTVRKYLKGL